MNHARAFILQRPPQTAPLILLFHGVGSNAQSMTDLGQAYASTFAQAMVVAVDALTPSDPTPAGWP